MNCKSCNAKLKGKQTMFCSNSKCQSNSIYASQQTRGLVRKRKLIEMKGGKCQICGYNKCISVLSFHHKVPAIKKFKLDIRHISNRTWKAILAEAEKCDLLCANCHIEWHFPTALGQLS